MRKLFIGFTFVIILIGAFNVHAVTLGDQLTFNIEPSYDLSQKDHLVSVLLKISPRAYFYVDQDWWKSLDFGQQSGVIQSLESLSYDFETRIYPVLTQTFGSEWNPGVDGDSRISVLLHPMKEEAQGYFNSADEYPKSQVPKSNAREMVYLNSQDINSPNIKIFLAHEFTHLIEFNQKERQYSVQEDTWLNEARAEYAPTLIGYDSDFQNSNIGRRIKNFMDSKFDSLTEWRNQPYDYGVMNLFTQYLIDYYGVKILADSLHSSKTGIESINEALKINGFSQDFSQIFTDWAIAIYVNNCNIGPTYCYKNPNLKNFRVTPLTNFLPLTGDSVLSTANRTKDWAGNWFKFTGGHGILKIDFDGGIGSVFKIPYLVESSIGNFTIDFLKLDSAGKGEVIVPDFGISINSITFVPSSQIKTTGFTDSEPFRQFSWFVSMIDQAASSPSPSPTPSSVIEQLLSQIDALQKQIAVLRTQLLTLTVVQPLISCQKFENNLYFGLKDNSEVRCLQEFLKSKGNEIYPEGFITGGFFNFTSEAVKRYQAQKSIIQTGYFGPLTRAAANQDFVP